jgi:DNA uptake protein ComE-like DNA-binding protein
MRLLLVALLSLGLCAAAPAATDAAATPNAAQAEASLVDINRASLDELKALKGIGEARAAAIVKGRPYSRKDELLRRKVIPESVYAEIKDLIIARQ